MVILLWAITFQAAKAASEPHDLVPSLTHQPHASSVTVVTSAPVLTTTVAGSLPSSAMPKVKPIQKQEKLVSATSGTVASAQPPPVTSSPSQVASSQSQVVSTTRQQPKSSHLNTSTHFVSSNNSPLNSTEEFLLAKNVKTAVLNNSPLSSTEEFFLTKNVTTAAPTTSMMAPKSTTVAAKENQLALHDASVQQHTTDVAKQLMQAIHQEKESQQSSERQLKTLSKTVSPNNSTEVHSSWPELLSQDEQRAMPLNVQEHHSVSPPTLSSRDLSGAPVSKSPFATQALPTANTVTHMPSTAVRVAKAPPSFFTNIRAPPTTGQVTPTTKVAQATVAAVRTSTAVMTSSGVQATPTNKLLMATGNQATPTTKTPATGNLAMPTTSRALPTQYQNISVPTSAVKTSAFVSATLAPPKSIAAGSPPTVTGPPHVTSPKTLTLEMPLVQLPKPPLQLFQDGENGYFFEQYGRMVSIIQ